MISRDLLFIEINDQHSVINDYLCIIVKSYADQEMNVTSQNQDHPVMSQYQTYLLQELSQHYNYYYGSLFQWL